MNENKNLTADGRRFTQILVIGVGRRPDSKSAYICVHFTPETFGAAVRFPFSHPFAV